MSDTEETPAAAPATSESAESANLVDGIRHVFGDEAADAVGGKPLVKQEPAAEPEKPAPPPVDERVSKRLLAAQRAEIRQAQLRKEMESERAKLAAEREAVKELAAIAEKAKLAKASPSKLLELAGLTPKDFLESLATENEPEQVARRVAEETKTETQKLREELDQLRKERELEATRAKQAEIQREFTQAQRGFVDHVATNADAYPNMQSLTERRILGLVHETLSRVVGRGESGEPLTELDAFIAEAGEPPTDEQIAAYIEQQLAAESGETLSARRARQGQNAPQPTGMTGESKPTPQDSRGQSPRTLTARAASSRAVAKRDLTQEEMDELSMQILRSATG
jgi:hypothetical protein